jgi:hypothetical protein
MLHNRLAVFDWHKITRMGARPIGLTLLAAALFVMGTGGFLIACAALLHPPAPPVRPCVGMLCGFDWRPIVSFLATVQAALSAWAAVSGAGLLARREWARRSTMVLGAVPFVLALLVAGHGVTLLLAVGAVGAGSPLIWYLERPKIKSWFAAASDGGIPGTQAAG